MQTAARSGNSNGSGRLPLGEMCENYNVIVSQGALNRASWIKERLYGQIAAYSKKTRGPRWGGRGSVEHPAIWNCDQAKSFVCTIRSAAQ